MNYFLAKTEPSTYSIDDLAKENKTVWDGVRNPQALSAIRKMKRGDRVLIYHSGGESRIVGLADVIADARPDPSDPKLAVVDLQFRGRIDPPVTLAEIKQSGLFQDWALVRQSRLSTMEVPAKVLNWLKKERPSAKL
jgi:predicted RNA-binding protein with PUA-like domain